MLVRLVQHLLQCHQEKEYSHKIKVYLIFLGINNNIILINILKLQFPKLSITNYNILIRLKIEYSSPILRKIYIYFNKYKYL